MKPTNKLFATIKDRWQIYLLVSPFLILFVLMTVLPVLSSVVLSFFNFDMVSMPKFTGLDNYLRMFIQDDVFPTILKNTILLAVLTGPLGFLLSFVLASFVGCKKNDEIDPEGEGVTKLSFKAASGESFLPEIRVYSKDILLPVFL